jgi:hypothetical protein
MTTIHKPDRTGRGTEKPQGKRSKLAFSLPRGSGWSVPLPKDLIDSVSIAVISRGALKLLFGLMSEHAAHAGQQNGRLVLPYDQMRQLGVRRNDILPHLFELRALGLVDFERGARSYGSAKQPSYYRLTWLATHDKLMPTNEWKGINTIEAARARIANALANLDKERREKAQQKQQDEKIPSNVFRDSQYPPGDTGEQELRFAHATTTSG